MTAIDLGRRLQPARQRAEHQESADANSRASRELDCGTVGRAARRECLDHLIHLSERHLRRILAEFVD